MPIINVVRIDSVFIQEDGFLADERSGEVVIMNVERSEYFAMDPVASRIWRYFSTPRSVAEVCDVLCLYYEAQREDMERDVLPFLSVLLKNGIIRAIQ
ncbi:MAG: PqqD family protein [Candidatus Riflebacteria bacterium]|nr:PqqD family protein [Candidatus Riflebacteria bacterium]